MERHVKINGHTYLYQQKAPFIESGESVKGAIEYNPVTDQLKCHECGEWFKHVGAHAVQRHDLTAEEYKVKHGLLQGTALIAEKPRERLILAGRKMREKILEIGKEHRISSGAAIGIKHRRRMRYELRNEHSTCHAQLIGKIQQMAEVLGRTPTRTEAQSGGISIPSAQLAFNMSWGQICRMAGLKPRASGTRLRTSHPRYSPEILLAILQSFYERYGRKPGASDVRRGLIPDYATFSHHFGSIREAYRRLDIAA